MPAVASGEEEPDVADDEERQCQVREVEGGIHCVHEDGQVEWERIHPSLWRHEELYLDSAVDPADVGLDAELEVPLPAGLYPVGDRHFYTVFRDLIEVDEQTGRVVRRVRFPAAIEKVEAVDEERLEVTLDVERDRYGSSNYQFELLYSLDGPEPSQTFWGIGIWTFANTWDADWLVVDLEEDEYEEAIERLKAAWEADRTNPFYAQLLGEWQERAGDEEAAAGSYLEAASATKAPWKDLMAVATRLESAGASDAADEAFAAGLVRIEEIGIARERFYSLVLMVLAFMTPQDEDALAYEAIHDGDAEEVHRLALRQAEAFPYVESGHLTWFRLAEWMEEQGRHDLADEWNQRAEANQERTELLFVSAVRRADRALLGMGACTIAVFILSLVIGLRSGAAWRRREDGEEDASNSKSWRNVFRLRDVVGLFVLYMGIFVCALIMSTSVVAIGEFAGAPINVIQDSLAAPDVEEWLEELHESSAQQELIALSREERSALAEGVALPERESVHDLIAEAVYADARQDQWDQLRSGRLPNAFAQANTVGMEAGPAPDGEKLHLIWVLFGLTGLGIIIAFGMVVGRFLPGLTRWALRIIPGGPASLAPLGALMLLAVVAGFLALAGLDSLLHNLASPAFPLYFGLGELGSYGDLSQPSRGWVGVVFAAVALLQVWAVFREIKAERQERDARAEDETT